MEIDASWAALQPQCCDADDYLGLGARCAAGGGCYEPLRPMGSTLWFALFDALGLPPSALVWVHVGLMLLSSALALRVALRWCGPALALRARGARRAWIAALGLAALLAHGVFLWPVLRHSLADPPAAVAALLALWLILLRRPDSGALHYAGIGLLLGLAAWVRAFYLYPVLGWLAAVGLLWALDRARRPRELWLLLALLPIGLQYAATWRHTGGLAYISPSEQAKWSELHLRDGSAGYDTLLRPVEAFRWPSPCSADNRGPRQALEALDLPLLACIALSRFDFYFGSYAPATYLTPRTGNLNTLEDVERLGGVELLGTRYEMNADRAPDGRHSASRLVVEQVGEEVGVRRALAPLQSGAYTFSVWAWAPEPATLDLRFYRQSDGAIAFERQVAIDGQSHRHVVSGTPLDGSPHLLLVGRGRDSQATWGRRVGDALYLWGGRLERGEQASPWERPADPRAGEARRLWSPVLLLAHLAAFAVVGALLWRSRAGLDRQRLGAVVLLGLLLAEGLAIVPEQRFMIAVQVALWTVAAFALAAHALHRTAPRRYGRSHGAGLPT